MSVPFLEKADGPQSVGTNEYHHMRSDDPTPHVADHVSHCCVGFIEGPTAVEGLHVKTALHMSGAQSRWNNVIVPEITEWIEANFPDPERTTIILAGQQEDTLSELQERHGHAFVKQTNKDSLAEALEELGYEVHVIPPVPLPNNMSSWHIEYQGEGIVHFQHSQNPDLQHSFECRDGRVEEVVNVESALQLENMTMIPETYGRGAWHEKGAEQAAYIS